MANTNSDIVTALASAKTDQSAPLHGRTTSAGLVYIRGQVTCPATPTVDDTLTLVPKELIPPGAIFEPAACWVFCETDPGTALTLDVGFASNPDALADALALTTAGTTGGVVPFDESGTVPAALADLTVVTTPEDVYATGKVSTAVDATVIQFCIAYYAVG